MAQHWIDEGLSWTPSDYDGMKEVTFGDSDVWTPTLSVHESYSVYGVRMFSSIKADYHGNVVWCPVVTFGLRCTMELRDFPFDEHRCVMNVSSWSHGYRIKLIVDAISRLNHGRASPRHLHPRWDSGCLDSHHHRSCRYVGSRWPYIILKFTMFLKRRSSNYHYTVMLPCVAISILTLFVFWLPPNSGKKITLGCTGIVSILLVMINLRRDLFRSLHVPKIVQFMGSTCIAIAVAVLIAVLVLNMVRTPMVFRPPGFLVNVLSGVVGRVLFLCPLPAPRPVDHEQLTDANSPLDKQDIITKQEWFLVAQGIDRLVFLFYALFLLAYHA
ncbi:neuronal acetylcholine receptor subunit alpha-3, putative [Ixodes scapularis]|uniref:Neuronal acetylcholine receptor subunit alpha-3, putative n=1 Tax=Ixodes scapularis TaxID=6945 RepID=B7PVN7_IXOSC|nr:neuronal acetylcholine receptor subunit alpha-3, putative [Ixodes scapularis]|eukprot:XP_002408268.1 neuronal acetylcholine receptor subunit alpha-3, putative [Ixodes scapularis]